MGHTAGMGSTQIDDGGAGVEGLGAVRSVARVGAHQQHAPHLVLRKKKSFFKHIFLLNKTIFYGFFFLLLRKKK